MVRSQLYLLPADSAGFIQPTFEVIRAIASLGTPALHVNEWGSTYLTERMVDTQLEIIQRNLLKMR